jgi:hypothetical protein
MPALPFALRVFCVEILDNYLRPSLTFSYCPHSFAKHPQGHIVQAKFPPVPHTDPQKRPVASPFPATLADADNHTPYTCHSLESARGTSFRSTICG